MPFLVPVCPVLEIRNGNVDTSACVAPTYCQVGTTLHYACESGFIGTNTTTTCTDNHSWDITPACKEEGNVNVLSNR